MQEKPAMRKEKETYHPKDQTFRIKGETITT